MKDLLGREINAGDLVVVKGTGRYNLGLRLGIMSETGSVIFRDGSKVSYGQHFLVETPSKAELEYKQKIIDRLETDKKLREEEMARRKATKGIAYKDLVIGKIYLTEKNEKVMFLGKGTVEKNGISGYRQPRGKQEGYLYLDIYSWTDLTFSFETLDNIYGRKGKKKLIKEIDLEGNIAEEFLKENPIVERTKEYNNYYYYREKSTIKLVLEGK